MKNKKNMYILLPAALLIWGILGYKIYSGLAPSNAPQEKLIVTTFKPQELKEAKPFTISTNYRDPFLGTYALEKPKRKKSSKSIIKSPKTPFPSIVYKGMMSSQGKNGIFLITVNGQQFFFKKRATNNEVKLIRGNTKEVVLQFQGIRQTFMISE